MTDTTPAQTRRIIVGDIHGELNAFTQILRHAGIIDRGNRWIAADTILIQTGDVIDRGPDSLGAVSLLGTLQAQAIGHSSRVVRCCGNHELMLLQQNFNHVNFSDPDALAERCRQEIGQGLLHAAYTDGSRLYTHAGVRTIVHDHLIEEIEGADPSQRVGGITLEALVEYINAVFSRCVAENRCESESHCIFWVDQARGGVDEVGGIFWCDYADIISSHEAWRVSQVFGHTPSKRGSLDHSHGLKLINVDAGMCKVYGGHTVYLEITPEGEVVQHSRHGNRWRHKALVCPS